jgi:hypothetical protein
MKKIILPDNKYTFDASARTITFTEDIVFKHLLLITNITDSIIIYNFACDGFGGSITGRVLTLDYDTTSMSDSDLLQIVTYTEEDEDDINKNELLSSLRENTQLLHSCKESLKECAKYLKKIYNPD